MEQELRKRRSREDSWDGFRSPYDRDRARILHSFAFRRLQAKTQVLGIREGDYHRTRLTHSMEVSQIARGLVISFQSHPKVANLSDPDLIEAISLAHDLGHPPFGHAGEVALHSELRQHGGFESNAQTLRLLTKLTSRHPDYGLDLTRRTLLGVLKYPAPYSKVSTSQNGDKPPKCYYDCDDDVVKWVLGPLCDFEREKFQHVTNDSNGEEKTTYKSFDCSIMDIADDLANGVYDFEDGMTVGLIRDTDRGTVREKATDCDLANEFDNCFAKQSWEKQRAFSCIMNRLIKSAIIEEVSYKFTSEVFRYNAKLREGECSFVKSMKDIVRSKIIQSHEVQTLESQSRRVVRELFQMINEEPERLLPELERTRLSSGSDPKERIVCDYIAGMTDEYATRIYERLKIPRHGSVFEKL